MKNKKNLLILSTIFLILSFIIGSLVLSNKKTPDAKLNVYIENETSIVYEGPMADEGVTKVKELFNDNINRLIIDSEGGDINIGMDLGEWVYDHQLDVEIRTNAFSSAANYVFTAGKTKYLHKNSMIGWHGGATQSVDNWFHKILLKNYLKEATIREEAFFKKIGVQQRSTVYGQRSEFNKYSTDESYVGWTYSLDAMKKLGINNIVLLDNIWTPTNEFNGKKIFTVTDVETLQS